MFQRWEHLLFLHWAVEPETLRPTLPDELEVDCFEGKAWLAVVPFRMSGVRPRRLPAVPWLSSFLEMNVRTYVRDRQGRPGVWFYSLDCNQPVAVEVARSLFKLDYYHARMQMADRPDGQGMEYSCWRRDRRSPARQQTISHFEYEVTGTEAEAEPGSLDFFLVERYRLFSGQPGRVRTGRVWHEPYRLSPVEVTQWDGSALQADGLNGIQRDPDHLTYARQVDVEVFPLE